MKIKKRLSPEEEKKRLYLYKQGLSDVKIGEICNVTSQAICKWREGRKLPPYNKKTRTDSLCWYCQNGRAHICSWIGERKKIWTRAKEQKRINNMPYYNGKEPEYTVYIVTECPHFESEGERKVAAV